MKKIVLLLTAIAIPVYAACPIDMDKPCTAEHSNEVRIDPDPVQEMTTPQAPDTPVNSNSQTYNSNCQFGVCLPGRTNDETLQNK